MRTLTTLLMLAACAGCASTSVENAAQPPATPAAQAVPAGPRASDPQDTWIQGKVFRVWPYGHGELMAYLGAKDGIRTGDTLALQRNGVTMNSIDVLEVRDETFYGRIVRRDDAGLWPKEGDMAVKIPPTE